MRFGPRDVVFLLLLLTVPVASWWLVFRPQNQEIAQARKEIGHKEEMLQKLDEVTSRTRDLEQATAEIRDGISLIEQRLPTGKEVETVLDDVASIARGHDLQLPKFVTENPVSDTGYGEQPLEIRLVGSFSALYSFMLDVERLERITRMPKMEIRRARGESGEVEAVLTLSIYFAAGGSGEAQS